MLKDVCKEEDVGLEIVVVIVVECFAPKARPRLLRPLIVLFLQLLAFQGVPDRLDRRELRLLELFGSRHVPVEKNALRENQIGSSEMLLSVREMFFARFQKKGDQFREESQEELVRVEETQIPDIELQIFFLVCVDVSIFLFLIWHRVLCVFFLKVFYDEVGIVVFEIVKNDK